MNFPLFFNISTFVSSCNFMLSWVEHEKSFITAGSGHPFDGLSFFIVALLGTINYFFFSIHQFEVILECFSP